jgi:glutaconyl-CoA/methylmalonyl-CoA decarboxylase subunit gamma
MIKQLRVTVDGHTYDVTVEIPDDNVGFTPVAAPAVAAPAPVPTAVATPVPAAPAPVAAPSSSGAGPGDVPSPLAGRVIAVNVTAGQVVKEGDHLITLEAMKMNTFVMAPKSGKVAAVKTSVGSAVEEGQALVSIE